MDHRAAASPVMGFPHLPPSYRDLMVDVLSTIEALLGAQLLPSDVLSFHGPIGASQAALDIRSGCQNSSMHRTFSWSLYKAVRPLSSSSWICFLAKISSYTLITLMNSTRLPIWINKGKNLRRYLRCYYIVLPLFTYAVYYHQLLLRVHLDSAAKEIIRIWLDNCANSIKQLGETEGDDLLRRDGLIKNKTVEMDLAANLARLFGPDVANRIVAAIQKAFRI